MLGDKLFGKVFKPFVYNIFIAGCESEDLRMSMRTNMNLNLTPLLSPMHEGEVPDQGISSLNDNEWQEGEQIYQSEHNLIFFKNLG